MKKIALYGLFALLFVGFAACGEENSSTGQASADPNTEAAPEEAADLKPSHKGVCLWDGAGLRDAAGKGAKWMTGISFGEVVSLTGNEEEVASEDRTYIEVELVDGQKGWANGYLFAKGAMRAVALADMDVYKRPDLTTFTGDKFSRGEIFALVPSDKEGWMEAYGKEKKKAGWVQAYEESYSTDEVDVAVGIQVYKALQEDDPAKQEEALNQLASSSTFSRSPLMSFVDETLAGIAPLPELPANQLYIMAENLNVRSEPDNEAENVLFQLNKGDICNILERGQRVQIREMDDYWYKIEKDGQSGWVYGYFTSKRR
ncbi:MAG: SH3 domain-containing protein [Bacteroidetes bacterium]|nr:MAG: SH3 domain-containing protein [Bacteroidota bacterium]